MVEKNVGLGSLKEEEEENDVEVMRCLNNHGLERNYENTLSRWGGYDKTQFEAITLTHIYHETVQSFMDESTLRQLVDSISVHSYDIDLSKDYIFKYGDRQS